MLNRRTLRIKVMQNVYSYTQCEKANFALAEDQIRENFSRDLNSLEVQDEAALRENQSLAMQAFRARFNGTEASETPEITEAVDDALDSYEKANKSDRKRIMKDMVNETENIVNYYYLSLLLLIEWGDLTERNAEKKKSKDPRGFYPANLANNQLVRQLRVSPEFRQAVKKHKISWENDYSTIKAWYKEVVREDPEIEEYESLKKPDYDQDRKVLEYLVKRIIFKNERILSFFEERDLNWDENREVVRSLVRKTIKHMEPGEDLELMGISYNWEEDRVFFEDLYRYTLENDDELEELISEKSHNWDIDRVAAIDKIILKLAIAEMTQFPSIPVKVTINEYIEIAKNYSTPKSRNFINGILDVLAIDLAKKGRIKKSGRGLIDNK